MAVGIDSSSIMMLNSSMNAFKYGNNEQGFENFRSVPPIHQDKVYWQLWVIKNRPQGNPSYGGQSFHDMNGLSSTSQEKARAIHDYLVSFNFGSHIADEPEYVPNNLGRNHNGQLRPGESSMRPVPKWEPSTSPEQAYTSAAGIVLGCIIFTITTLFISKTRN